MQQLGFDLDYVDPVTHAPVPWAEVTPSLLEDIKSAPWKFFDTETTGLNPASKEQNFSNKAFQRGVNTILRLRVATVLYPSKFPTKNGLHVVAFDMDQLTGKDKKLVAEACFSEVVFAHNAGFDAYWARNTSKNATPKRVVDSMLLARVLAPNHPIVMARMSADEEEDPELRQAAFEMFQQSRSGWSLADLSVGILRKIIPKDSQGPKNWCEPFLTQKNYDYATSDVCTGYELCMALLQADPSADLLEAYLEEFERNKVLRLVEPQVMDIMTMRENGMPWDAVTAENYIASKYVEVAALVDKLIKMEPSLEPFRAELANPNAGTGAKLKDAVGKAFSARGIELQLTDSTNAFKVGEKDLRRVKAASSGETKELFKAWVGINRAKKAAGMAKEVTRYANASHDGRLHPNTGHGPVTGRLSSSEPNCQQFPRDQGFRDCVTAADGKLIVASDYSALDMRVGGALAIRAQQQIFEAYMGERKVDLDVLRIIQRVYDRVVTSAIALTEEARATKAFEDHKRPREEVDEMSKDGRTKYWEIYKKLMRTQKLAHFQRCLAQVRERADAANAATWGSLRNAFAISGMDIHTWTALGMLGQDPQALFSGLSDADVAVQLKAKKKELGDHRQTGKVGNLSLLYAMKTLGLQEAAAKNYDIHWTFEEADKVRVDWLNTYVELDLWHAWTEFNAIETVRVPDPERGGRIVKKDVFASYTLSDRLVYAFGLNAALSYEDQSSGADILGLVMKTLREEHNPVFQSVINQVHDEVVFEVPEDQVEGYTATIGKVMTDCAEHFLRPYGVKGECSPAVGKVWLKD